MELLAAIKTAIRLKTDSFDDELTSLAESCKKDMDISGVKVIKEDDPLTRRAITLYVKANFGDLDESGRYQTAYDHLKNSMAVSGDYGTEAG